MRVANVRQKCLQWTLAENLEWKRKTMPSSSLRDAAINLYSKARFYRVHRVWNSRKRTGVNWNEQLVGTYLLDIYEQ